GVCILAVPYFTDFDTVFGLMLAHLLFFAPTMALTNSIAFANIRDAKSDFGPVRLWGTIGWIAASVPMLLMLGAKSDKTLSMIFTVSGLAAIALGFFAFALPKTPPSRSQEGGSFTKAIGLLAQPVMLVLFITTFLDMIVHTGYFFFCGRLLGKLGVAENWIMPAMAVGQVAEIGTMAILGIFLKRLGWKTTMTLGILGHAVRFLVFWHATPEMLWVVILINVLHGICYAFFFATVFIFIDEHFPKDIRNNAQSLFNVAVLGVGQLLGNYICGQIEEQHTSTVDRSLDFPGMFKILTFMALGTAFFFMLFFWPKSKPTDEVDREAAEVGADPEGSHPASS
ncbi:MAG TPA: MFS transporter, partial [Planctomycetia bacterium]|nr:MFS transporter [Planctomycetia bacterium]